MDGTVGGVEHGGIILLLGRIRESERLDPVQVLPLQGIEKRISNDAVQVALPGRIRKSGYR
jgi:hypothetical protein